MDDFEIEVTGVAYTSDYKKFVPDNPLNRPDIRYKNVILSALLFLLILAAVYAASGMCAKKLNAEDVNFWTWLSTIASGLIYLYAISKRAVIWCVKVYQHYAPEDIRLRCAFEPSCSEYMILAVKKYGTIKGVTKGIKRLLRCHPPGGVDYP